MVVSCRSWPGLQTKVRQIWRPPPLGVPGAHRRGCTDPMELSDAALLRACRGGDQDAWTTLVNRYQRLIYTIPRRAGLDEQAAADVFQRVFASLVEHLDTLTDPDRLRAWLVTT